MPNGENLGAKFTIDISDLKAGLAQANRLIRESESEFLEAAAGMEDWEESAEGLTKRVKTLSDQVEIQQGKVSALVAEKERIIKTMTDEGKSNEEIEKAVDGVNKSIQREGKQLETLKKKLKQSETNLDKFNDSTDDAADALEDMADESKDTRKATDKLTDEIEKQKKQLDKLTKEYSDAVLEQGEMSDEAVKLRNQIKNLNKELQNNEKRLDSATDGLGDLGKGAKDSGDGFNLSKAAVGGFVAGGLTALVGAVGSAISGMMDLAESTRETRTNMAKLETAFESAGLSAEDASETFETLYGVLGDEGRATESAAFLAKYADDEKELAEQTRILTGVFAEYGDSIPTEGLAEGIQATISMGEVQGVLADALEWQGVNLEDFNEKLAKCTTEKEREALITETLNGLYGDSADAFVANNAAVIKAQEATANYNTAMANLGGKVEPLNTAMTNLKTTLANALAPAIGTVAQGLAGWIENLIAVETGTDLLTESQRAAVTAAQASATEYRNLESAADALADAQLANVGYAEEILQKLSGLVDETGNVKAGEEDHANFLLGEYNNALGTEYKNLQDIFTANGDIKQSVYDVIAAKKAQILMSAYEEQYKAAVMDVAAQEKARAIQAQEIAAQQKVADEARTAADEAWIVLQGKKAEAKSYADHAALMSEARMVEGLKTEALKQEGILADKQTAYNETEDLLYDYYATISDYENANVSLMEGNTEEALGYLQNLGDGYNGAASSAEEAAKTQYEVLEQQVIDTQNHAEWMREAYANGVKGVTEDMVKTAEEQAAKAKTEFEAVGGNITEGIGVGAEAKKSSLGRKIGGVISSALAAAKKAAGIESPSKLFRDEVGEYIGEGVAVGIDDSTADVVKSIDKQVNSALNAYDVGKISDELSGKLNVKTSGAGGSSGLASGAKGGVTVYQTNNYSQAHSRYEIYKSQQETAAAVRLALGGA